MCFSFRTKKVGKAFVIADNNSTNPISPTSHATMKSMERMHQNQEKPSLWEINITANVSVTFWNKHH
jgi:tRNA(Arg) A34 adenosine deaminase TadA